MTSDDTASDRAARGRTDDPYQATFTDGGLERQATLDEQDDSEAES